MYLIFPFLFINQFHLIQPELAADAADVVVAILARGGDDDDVFRRAVCITIFQRDLQLLIARDRLARGELAIGDDAAVVRIEELAVLRVVVDLVNLVRQGDIDLAHVRLSLQAGQVARVVADHVDRRGGIFVIQTQRGGERAERAAEVQKAIQALEREIAREDIARPELDDRVSRFQ